MNYFCQTTHDRQRGESTHIWRRDKQNSLIPAPPSVTKTLQTVKITQHLSIKMNYTLAYKKKKNTRDRNGNAEKPQTEKRSWKEHKTM